MPQMIDLAEVEAAMERFRERAKPRLEKEGYDGVLARLQYEAAAALTYWRVREINRATSPPLMMEALSMFFAATVAGEIKQVIPDNKDVQFGIANEAIQNFAVNIGRILDSQEAWGAAAVHIEGKEAGTA